ncbi:hypothetical protein N431DRAFT_521953, partial [Stipitochalara longipes BDJ]
AACLLLAFPPLVCPRLTGYQSGGGQESRGLALPSPRLPPVNCPDLHYPRSRISNGVFSSSANLHMDCMDPRQGVRRQGHPTRFDTTALAADAPKDHGAERTRRSACCPCHDSIISCSTFGERTARFAVLSELKRHRAREQQVCVCCVCVHCVETAAGRKPQTQFPDGPVGPKKNCSTLRFGRRALKISSICRPAPSNNDENDKFAGQILPPSVVHQCFRHPRLMSSVVDVKIPVQTSGGDKQGGPENLRRNRPLSSSWGSLHLRVHTTVFAGIGHPWPLLPHPGPPSSELVRFEFTVPACYAGQSSRRHPGPPPLLRIIPTTSVIAVQGFKAWGIEGR